MKDDLRELERFAMQIVHLVGRIQHEKVPDSTTSKAFVDIRQASNDEAIEAIMQLISQYALSEREKVREEMTPVTIMGKTLDEVCVILSALELERIADMKMTMSHLDDWMKLVREDHHKAVQKALNKAVESTLERSKEQRKES